MNKATPIRYIKILLFIIAALVVGNASCRAEDIASVLASPRSYHGKRVEVTGIARGDADRFYLFANAPDAVALKVQRAMDVFAPKYVRPKGSLTLRRVRAIGVIDANWHGHSAIPCALRLKKLEILSGPVLPWPNAVTVFRNETAKAVVVHFGIPPTETKFEVLSSDFIEVRAEDGPVRATSSTGSHIADGTISKQAEAPFYDPANAASYYRIKDDKIENVLPSSAKSWGWHR